MAMNRKGAIELSIGTIVILVIGMSMLIMGLVLVRTIFSSATSSVTIIDDKIKGSINQLFSEDESKNVLVMLGGDNTAKIKPDTANFGIAVAARTSQGSLQASTLTYKLSLGEGDCKTKVGEAILSKWFGTSLLDVHQFDQISGSNAIARIIINVPKGVPTCSQKVYIDVTDSSTAQLLGRDFLVMQVMKAGFFG